MRSSTDYQRWERWTGQQTIAAGEVAVLDLAGLREFVD
jgi:hypothetical protein